MANSLKRVIPVVAFLTCALLCFSGTASRDGKQSTHESGAGLSKWKAHDYSVDGYVGSTACAECHAALVSAQESTPMAHSMELAANCKILISNPKLTYRNGPFVYQITRQGDRSIYTVTDGASTISEPILSCFGEGVAGQTYLFRHRGVLYESRVSYYPAIRNLDITILHPRSVPSSIESAIGRPMTLEASEGCFDCHSTTSSDSSGLRLDSLIPGITCERCHGPGSKHVAAMKSKDFGNPNIFNPGSLDSLDQNQEFCGFCHQGFEKVMELEDHGGIENVRFQPYRMFKSRGHLVDDPRIGCIACHDPHNHLKREAGFYDSKCFACHLSNSDEKQTGQRSAPPCPVAAASCVTCHMPKVELPEMHFKFTDHWIRIVRPNEPVPK
ncbi:MAG TPA: multiheme c-type cytochrome [Blastocatellia bacterium]|nr:multiheme c-type cytochrome [Blastocatellia bacterium]